MHPLVLRLDLRLAAGAISLSLALAMTLAARAERPRAAPTVSTATASIAATAATENAETMARMMKAMNVASSGSVDLDFVTQMIPHHQAAIDMARTELRYGSNEQARRIAQGIVVAQLQEIAAMELLIKQELKALAQPGAAPHSPAMHAMPMKP